MQIRDVVASLLRRWYVLLGGIVVAVLAAGGVLYTMPATYEQSSSSVLIPGRETMPEDSNPFLYLGGLVQQRDLLVRTMQSDAVRMPLLEDFPGADLTVAIDTTTSGPIVSMTASGPTSSATSAVLEAAQTALGTELKRLQDEVGTPPDAASSLLYLAGDAEPAAVLKTQLQIAVLAALAVVGVTVLGTGWLDGRLLARAARRSTRAELDLGPDDIGPEIYDADGTSPAPSDSAPSDSAPSDSAPSDSAPSDSGSALEPSASSRTPELALSTEQARSRRRQANRARATS